MKRMMIDLSSKNLTTIEPIFESYSDIPKMTEVNLSNNNLTFLPSDLSMFQNLVYLDLTKNKFKDYLQVSEALASLPRLRELKIDLNNQQNVFYVLSNLPNLDYLNEKPVKEQNPIDINEKESEEISLQNEKDNFNNITKRIETKIKSLNQSTDFFFNEFQKFFKSQIEKLANLNENMPNYLYNEYVLHSIIDIYLYLLLKTTNLLTSKSDSEIVSISKDIIQHISRCQEQSLNLIVKISGNFENYIETNNNEDLSKEYQNKINILEENLQAKETHCSQLLEENKALIERCEKLEEMLSENNQQMIINSLASSQNSRQNELNLNKNGFGETKKINIKAIKKQINSGKNNTNSNNQNYYLTEDSESVRAVGTAEQKSRAENNSKLSTPFLTNTSNFQPKIKKEDKAMIGPITQRTLSLKAELELINEIYQSKLQSDKKLQESGQQKETLEQHMFTYLNHKFGLKNLVIEYASALIAGIRKYSKENGEVCLFGKILRNEIEETQILLIPKLKSVISTRLTQYLQKKYTLKSKGDIDQIAQKIKTGFLSEEEYTFIIQSLFQNENEVMMLNERVLKSIYKNNPNPSFEDNKISYQKFIQIVINFQIRLRDNYLANFNELFKKVDGNKDGILNANELFIFLNQINIFQKDELEQYVYRVLEEIDPFKTDSILYTDLINLLSREFILDEDPETGERQKISILDKISFHIEN